MSFDSCRAVRLNYRPRTVAHSFALALIICAIAGCATATRTTSRAPAPSPQLLSSAPFELPRNCEPMRAAVYRMRFVVQTDGSVAEAGSESGEGCVQDALLEWVSSFRYEPVFEQTPVVFDWLAVIASRGS